MEVSGREKKGGSCNKKKIRFKEREAKAPQKGRRSFTAGPWKKKNQGNKPVKAPKAENSE